MNKLLVILLEPAPYHFDLWNEYLHQNHSTTLKVIFTEAKDRLPDAGHDFQHFPDRYFPSVFLDNYDLFSTLHSCWTLTREILFGSYTLFYLSSYHKIQTFYALVLLSLFRKKYFFHIDQPNNSPPTTFASRSKRLFSLVARRIVSQASFAILSCGARGVSESKIAFRRDHRIYNFPYAVSKARILSDALLHSAVQLPQSSRIILFSGRLISRKGLSLLLDACSRIPKSSMWHLLVEGDGPLYENYVSIVRNLNLDSNVTFLGFSQYSLHSYYLSRSNIVVVPSLQDNWGIVVDEALQLGKLVIASNSVGSAVELILDRQNGLLFESGDVSHLHRLLVEVLSMDDKETLTFLPLRSESSLNTPAMRVEMLNKLSAS